MLDRPYYAIRTKCIKKDDGLRVDFLVKIFLGLYSRVSNKRTGPNKHTGGNIWQK